MMCAAVRNSSTLWHRAMASNLHTSAMAFNGTKHKQIIDSPKISAKSKLVKKSAVSKAELERSYTSAETPSLSEPPDKSSTTVCSILESDAHRSILKALSMDSMIDLIVGYILASDIMVERVALECNLSIRANKYTIMDKRSIQPSLDPKIKVAKFTVTDDALIEDNWKSLIEGLGLEEEKAIDGVFENISKKDKDIGLKRNIIGYFLSQGLSAPRLATEVFHRAVVLMCLKTGDFSTEEDKIILEFVKKEGRDFSTLAKLLNRRNNSVWIRHDVLLSSPGRTSKDGTHYTIEEDKLLLTEVFAVDKNILDDRTIGKKDWARIGKMLGRSPQGAYQRWRSILEPMLKKYHADSLFVDEKELLINHMVDHDMHHSQDVDWNEIVKLPEFAGASKAHLQYIYQMLISQTRKKYKLSPEELTSKEIQKYQLITPKKRLRKNKAEHTEKLVQFYQTTILGSLSQ